MRLSVQGMASPELPLRVLNLLAQHGVTPRRAVLELRDGGYHMRLDTPPVAAERGDLILEKLRSMVLVTTAEVAAAPRRRLAKAA